MESRSENKRRSASEPEKRDVTQDHLPAYLSTAVAVVAFLVYLLTLSPGVSWAHHSEDSGDLITAAWVLGIPHPTGYPLFCMLGWIWSHAIPVGSVAWRMNAFSALWGACAAGLAVRAAWSGLGLLSDETILRIGRGGRAVAAVSSGLLLAFATDVWSQSVVTEVYSLNLLFTSLISWILIELVAGANYAAQDRSEERAAAWNRRRSKLISVLGLSSGLALTNHLTGVLLLPSVILVPAIAGVRVRGGDVVRGILWFLVPLLLYLYLPIRSLMNPPLDWGNPENLDGFIWVVTGRQFRKLMFVLLPYQMLHQVMTHSSVPEELGAMGALAAMAGICRLVMARARMILSLLVHSLLLVAGSMFYLASYYIWDPEGYLLPMVWAVSFWAGWAPALLVELPTRMRRLGSAVAMILLVCAPIYALFAHWSKVDLSANYEAMRFGREAFDAFEKNALAIEARYERAFTLWYYRDVEYAGARDDVAVIFAEHGLFKWGLDLFSREYPDLILPQEPITGENRDARTAAFIIENNIDRRPVYCGAIVTSLEEEGYRFEAVGLMYRVFPP